MLVFSQYFSLDVLHLNYSIYIWNCCNQVRILNKKIITKCLATKNFEWQFVQVQIQENIIAILRIVTIEKSHLIFLPISYSHVRTLKNKIYRYMSSIFKNVCNDELDDMVNNTARSRWRLKCLRSEPRICFRKNQNI